MSNPNEKTELPTAQWIEWFAAMLVAALAVVLFIFSTFVTKESYRSNQDSMDRRLDRIEVKIDKLVEEK